MSQVRTPSTVGDTAPRPFDFSLVEGHNLIAVVGPTASGKSEFAQKLAVHLGAEILSADSMQVYRGMDIGTAKVPPEKRSVKYHGLDLVDPGEQYSASLYQDYARGVMEDARSKGTPLVICGGTGFYVRAALDDYRFAPGEQKDNPVRARFESYAHEHGDEALHELLETLDPASAAIIHPHNVKRVIRALEMHEEGDSYAKRAESLSSLPEKYPALWLMKDIDTDVLNERIDARVDSMIEAGLIDEVRGLLDSGFREGVCAPAAIGYKELVAPIDASVPDDDPLFSDAIRAIKLATRRYAKRQRTWFRAEDRIVHLRG